MAKEITSSTLATDILQIVESGMRKAYANVNSIGILTYWLVGQRIVKEEQNGAERAAYGVDLIGNLAKELSAIYPKGYSARSLREYRQFYLYFKDFEIWHSRVPNLTWTHCRMLLRVADDNARYWYLHEAAREMWSVRTLGRNIGSQYYYRLLQSPQKEDVIAEMTAKTAPYQEDALEYIKKSCCGGISSAAKQYKFHRDRIGKGNNSAPKIVPVGDGARVCIHGGTVPYSNRHGGLLCGFSILQRNSEMLCNY